MQSSYLHLWPRWPPPVVFSSRCSRVQVTGITWRMTSRWADVLSRSEEDRRIGRVKASERAADVPSPAAPRRRARKRGAPENERFTNLEGSLGFSLGLRARHPREPGATAAPAEGRSWRCQGKPLTAIRLAGLRRFLLAHLPARSRTSPGPRGGTEGQGTPHPASRLSQTRSFPVVPASAAAGS